MHFTGEESEIQWCTLIMEIDQKLLDLAGSLLQTISRTQENLGEMLKIQKRKNEMNHQILQNSIGLQKEVKILLGEIPKGKESGSMMGHLPKRSVKKRSRHEDSKEIEQVKMKQPAKCWKCGGHHYRRNFPTREHQEVSSHKVPRLGVSRKLTTSRRSSWKPRGLVLKVQSK